MKNSIFKSIFAFALLLVVSNTVAMRPVMPSVDVSNLTQAITDKYCTSVL